MLQPVSARCRPLPLIALVCAALLLVASGAGAAAPAGKVLVDRGVAPQLAGARLLHDYGAFALYEVPAAALASAPARPGVTVLDETIRFDAQAFRPGVDPISAPEGFEAPAGTGPGLQLVQFVGPVREEWLGALRAQRARPVHYVANQGYLVWADAAARQQLDGLAAAREVLQYSAPLSPWFKLGPTLRARYEVKGPAPEGSEIVPVTIQIVRHDDLARAEEEIERLTVRRLSAWTPILEYQNLVAEMRLADVPALARRGDVVHVVERLPRELLDEVQGQIVAGNFDAGQTGPSGPGYLAFLSSFGFPTDPAAYPLVDITDDGIGGNASPTVPNNPTLDSTLDPRVAYRQSCHSSYPNDGRSIGGHGHINASILAGIDTRTGAPYQDADGFQRGLGINPWARVGGTRIFSAYNVALCGGTDTGVILANWNAGARISTNSWGCGGCAGTYDDGSQAYDVGVRDADLSTPGNQQLIYFFAAGNDGSGAGTIGTPGNGKNMITVGASENDRPTWTDGCGIGPTGANNAMDVISFSSRGPAPGNRKKPELIAPGTHIQGTASTHPSYDGSGVCDQWLPAGQTVFAASSGTSHSTPAVAGVGSLAYWWMENTLGMSQPSPALMKAYLMAHPTYLTGVSANDTLPSNSQGYGMPTLGLLFDDAQKFALDQSEVFDDTGETFTWLGAVDDPARPVRIALAYTDQAGAIGTSPQVNNLNLAADVDGTTYLGNVFSGRWSVTGGAADPNNNYEAVFLPAGTSGAIQITVTAANIAGNGVPNIGDGTDQDFALVCYNCVQEPTFTLGATPATQAICAPANAVYDLSIASVLGFSESVTLSATGHPAGTTTAFSVNPVIPPGTSVLTIGNTGAASPGNYLIDITGTAASATRNRQVGLDLYSLAPAAPALTSPAPGVINQPIRPTFTWGAVAQAETYRIQIATDPGFASVVLDDQFGSATTYVPSIDLASNTTHYWRVAAFNPCGAGAWSAASSFATLPLPGDCPLGSQPVAVYSYGFEAGASGWTTPTGVGTNTWAIVSTNPYAGASHYRGVDSATITDQRLVSPALALPAGQDPVVLRFWHAPNLENSGTTACFDGGILEVSTNGGTTWTQVTGAGLLLGGYTGTVSGSFSNPLAGLSAWCGPNPAPYQQTIADLSGYAGQTVQLRWRIGTDTSVSRPGWDVDGVFVQACSFGGIFGDGFDGGTTLNWSATHP